MRRKGELTMRRMEQDWPIKVVVLAERYASVMEKLHKLSAPRSGRLIGTDGKEYLLRLFRNEADAELVRAACDGWHFDAARVSRKGRLSFFSPPNTA